MAGSERGAGAQVDDPLADGDPLGEGVLVGDLRGGQVSGVGAGAVGRAHVCVVGGVGVESGERLGDPRLLVLGQGRVHQLLLTDGGGGRVARGPGGAERAEPVGGKDLGLLGELVGEAVRGGELVVDQVVGVVVPEQVRAAGGPEQQGAAGEDGDLLAGELEGVGQVGVRVARCRDGADAQQVGCLHHVTVPDRGALEGDLVLAVHVVCRAGRRGQGQAARDVVVVDVGLEDVSDSYALAPGEVEDAVDVALRVDDDRDLPVVGEVGAVAEGGGVDRDDGRLRSHAQGSLPEDGGGVGRGFSHEEVLPGRRLQLENTHGGICVMATVVPEGVFPSNR